jgi:DNA segregation ATPase FtsK/SpoIIIE, S-DNA-T family
MMKGSPNMSNRRKINWKGLPGRKTGDTPVNNLVPEWALSIHQPIFLGLDENGVPVYVELAYRNLLVGGEPGGGKSVLLNNIVGHAALCPDVTLVLIDGKQVELGMWREVADVFVGNNVNEALTVLGDLQAEMDWRYDWLVSQGRRKVVAADGLPFIVVVIDEVAYFSATVGTKKSQDEFINLTRDLVARGRAAGVIMVLATQRPSADIVPTSLRDICAYRCAFRCTTEASSDIILGTGWAKQGYNATDITPEARGVGWLLAEGGTPRRFKGAYLTDTDIRQLVAKAKIIRARKTEGGPSAEAAS